MTINIILNGKGGIGKSFISSIVSQYLIDNKEKVVCIDTDPNNTTLYAIKELKSKFLEITDGNSIDLRKFDKLIELIMNDKKSNYVIDSGATSFLPLIEYLNESAVLPLLKENFNIVLHVPIVGGQAQETTISGFVQIFKMFKEVDKFIAWVNPYHGKLDINSTDGTRSQDLEKHIEIDKLSKSEDGIKITIIKMPIINNELTGKDLEQMTKLNYTFNQVSSSSEFSIVSKSRLNKYKNDIYNSLKQTM